MKSPRTLRGRLTLWYVFVLAVLLILYAATLFFFQYVMLTRQLLHDEIQDVVTVEGLFYFDQQGTLRLHQDYYSRPDSHLLVDRLMEVRDLEGHTLYRSPTLGGMEPGSFELGGRIRHGEGDKGFGEHIVRLPNGSHVFLISHIHTLDGHTLLIRLGYSLVPLRRSMLQFLLLLAGTTLIMLTLAALAGQIIARRALSPLKLMTTRAASITAHSLHERLDESGPLELGHLAQVFNRLLDRLEQSFTQLRRFTADAAHELRTPLAAVRTLGEVTLEKGESPATHPEIYKEALVGILEEAGRLNETIDSLLMLARAEAPQSSESISRFPASELVDEILTLFAIILEERRITVLRDGAREGAATLSADRSLLRVALLNVLHNALKFSPSGSVLRIEYTRPGAHTLRIAITDQGPGIAPGEHDRLFDRFFTGTRRAAYTGSDSSTGTGLGLSVASLVISRLGGSIHFDEHYLDGARCLIELPISGL